jgi:O-methyltransferase
MMSLIRSVTRRFGSRSRKPGAQAKPKSPNKKQEGIGIIFRALKSWGKPEGDYLEFGVYRGRAFIEAFRAADRVGLAQMRFFAFDSFEGLPVPNDAERHAFAEGQYACSETAFLDNLRDEGVDLSRVKSIPGFFDKSLTPRLASELEISCARVVWVDCDLYESAAPVLDFVTDLVETGSIIAFDDWWSFAGNPHMGEIRATREWLSRNPSIQLEHYRDFGASGRIFVVQKASG